MGVTMQPARRVTRFEDLTRAGDYYGPAKGWTDDKDAVFFLLPIARDEDTPPQGRSVHCVVSPPHVFRECPDGSLEIRESIGAGPGPDGGRFYWHGYLDEGNTWRQLPG